MEGENTPILEDFLDQEQLLSDMQPLCIPVPERVQEIKDGQYERLVISQLDYGDSNGIVFGNGK